MTQPIWIKCSEQMPPDTVDPIILRHPNGEAVRELGSIAALNKNYLIRNEFSWIPYEEATWNELNK